MMKMIAIFWLRLVAIFATLSYSLHGFAPVAPLAQRRTSLATSVQMHQHNPHFDDETTPDSYRRRRLVHSAITATLSLFAFVPHSSNAASEAASVVVAVVEFERRQNDFGYNVKLPQDMSQPSNKPLKTHLDEVNFKSPSGDVSVGITVDPVRIFSLKEFGTPPEVAARVVTAEVNRDGVFEVTLVEDPVELQDGSYVLQYLSKGKRGNKRNVCKIFIRNQKLYVLTAQAKEDAYEEVKQTIQSIVDSFTLL